MKGLPASIISLIRGIFAQKPSFSGWFFIILHAVCLGEKAFLKAMKHTGTLKAFCIGRIFLSAAVLWACHAPAGMAQSGGIPAVHSVFSVSSGAYGVAGASPAESDDSGMPAIDKSQGAQPGVLSLPPPGNDACAAGLNPPYVLSPNASCTNGTLSQGTTQAGETFGCFSPTPSRTVWYSFIATQTDMWVSVKPTGAIVCSQNFGLAVYQYTGGCPPAGPAGCKNFQAYSAQNVYNNLELTGLVIGATYLIQLTQNPGCTRYTFCVQVGTYLNCSSCSSPCGPMCTFAGYSPPGPPPATVVASCPGYPLGPPMNQFDTETHCYTFTAPNDSVYLQQVVWSYCSPNTYSFTYNLYTSGCALMQSGNVFSNNLITGLTPGTVYRMCYTLQAACSWDSLIYPYMYTTASQLPVELLRFEAEGGSDGIRVTWSTASETNNREFVLERTRNAIDFTEVARVKGAGNSTTLKEYAVHDPRPYQGMNFYRLRQIDFDGRETTTQLVSARFTPGGPPVTVSPNPAGDRCMVRYFAAKNSAAHIDVYDVKGRRAVSLLAQHDESRQYEAPVDLAGLEPGIYYLHVVTDEEAFTTKLIRQ
jgi:hypothetical protein